MDLAKHTSRRVYKKEEHTEEEVEEVRWVELGSDRWASDGDAVHESGRFLRRAR